MSWTQRILKPFGFLKRRKEEEPASPSTSEVVHLTLPVMGANHVPVSRISELIILNPWTISRKPEVRYRTEDGSTYVDVSFRVLKQEKSRQIERDIRKLIQTENDHG